MINIKKIEAIAVKISSILFSIMLSFLTIILLIFVILSIGIDLENSFKNSSLEIDRVSLKLDRGLIIRVDGLFIKTGSNSSDSGESPDIDIQLIQDLIISFQQIFREISVTNMKIDNYRVDKVLYRDSKIAIKSQNGQLQTEFYIDNNYNISLTPKLQIFTSEYRSKVGGVLNYNLKSGDVHSRLRVSFKDSISGKLYGKLSSNGDVNILFNSNSFNSLTPLFKTLKLPESAFEWGVRRLENGRFRVKAETGFNISEPKRALKNLKAVAKIEDLHYRFNPVLDVAEADEVVAKIGGGDLIIDYSGLKYQSINIEQDSLKVWIADLFSRPKLGVNLEDQRILIDRTLLKTIEAYGSPPLPLTQKGGEFRADFSLNLPFKDGKLDILTVVSPQNALMESAKKELLLKSGRVTYNGNLSVRNLNVLHNDMIDLEVNSDLNLSNLHLITDIDLNRVELNETLKLKKPLHINLTGEANGSLFARVGEARLNILGDELNSSRFRVSLRGKGIDLHGLNLSYSNYNLSVGIDSFFNLQRMVGRSDISIKQFNLSPIAISSKHLKLYYRVRDRFTLLTVPTLDSKFRIGEKIDVRLSDISKYLKFIDFEIPQVKTVLKGGELNSTIDGSRISFSGNFDLNQSIIRERDGEFIEKLPISGEVNESNISIKIDNSILLQKDSSVALLSDGYDYNISGVTALFDDNSSDEVEENNSSFSLKLPLKIDIFGQDNRVYIGGGSVFESERLYITGEDNSLYLQTECKKSQLEAQVVDNRFILKGIDIRDKFIHKLSGFNGFRGGVYNLYGQGTEDNISGILQFSNFTMKNFSLYNNLLAFLNTIPALLTFSQPGFNEDGFRIKAGYILFHKFKNRVYLNDIQIHGKTTSVTGKGYIDLEKQKLNILLNISTVKSLDKLISNIPIANYLILGDDGSMATSVSIFGTFDNIRVRPEIHKDIISTPMEVAKRVLQLPARILEVIKRYYDSNRVDEVNQIKSFFKR